jgi:L-alanine-DL-glutamate epimerase-like enolase superfamily enzyme
MPWFSQLYNEAIEFRDGNAVMPERPGWGFTFDMDCIAHLEARTP